MSDCDLEGSFSSSRDAYPGLSVRDFYLLLGLYYCGNHDASQVVSVPDSIELLREPAEWLGSYSMLLEWYFLSVLVVCYSTG